MNLIFKILLFFIIILLGLFLLERTTEIEFGITDRVDVLEVGDENDEDGEEEEDEKIQIIDGFKAVEIDDEIVESAGIQYGRLYSINYTPEFVAHAEVMDIAPLVSLKTKYKNLLSEKIILENSLQNLNKIYKRAKELNNTKSLSTRELEINRADRDLKATQLSAMLANIENMVYEIRSNWGRTMADLILNDNKQAEFDQLARRTTSLILLSLLKDQSLQPGQQDVYISYKNERESASLAAYLDKSNQISHPLYGESYIYTLKSDKLRAGMRVFAWVEKSSETETGLFIPESAVIWYANQPWVYIKGDGELFVRRPIAEAIRLTDGWLERRNQFRDKEVVIQGGQTLLSEEFKWAIPDEDDD